MFANAFNEFLIENNLLPYQNNLFWKKLIIHHFIKTKDQIIDTEKDITSQLKAIGFSNGVYLYENAKGEVLYIGKGVNKGAGIAERLKSHHKKACDENFVPQRQRHRKIVQLFRSNFGELNVYVCNLENDYEATAVEAMLTEVLKPLYVDKDLYR